MTNRQRKGEAGQPTTNKGHFAQKIGVEPSRIELGGDSLVDETPYVIAVAKTEERARVIADVLSMKRYGSDGAGFIYASDIQKLDRRYRQA